MFNLLMAKLDRMKCNNFSVQNTCIIFTKLLCVVKPRTPLNQGAEKVLSCFPGHLVDLLVNLGKEHCYIPRLSLN